MPKGIKLITGTLLCISLSLAVISSSIKAMSDITPQEEEKMMSGNVRDKAACVIQAGFRRMQSRKEIAEKNMFGLQGARPFWRRVCKDS